MVRNTFKKSKSICSECYLHEPCKSVWIFLISFFSFIHWFLFFQVLTLFCLSHSCLIPSHSCQWVTPECEPSSCLSEKHEESHWNQTPQIGVQNVDCRAHTKKRLFNFPCIILRHWISFSQLKRYLYLSKMKKTQLLYVSLNLCTFLCICWIFNLFEK